MTKLPTSEFMRTLGKYVYCFTKTNNYKDAYYGGKSGLTATGTRCLDHIKDKGYDYNDIMIIARNLETFDNRPEELLESWLIMTEDFDDNRKSGTHKECFVMVDLSSLFSDYVDSQRDMFKELNDLVNDNLEVFKGKMGFTETRGSSYYIETGMRDNIYFGIKVQTKEPNITCMMKANNPTVFSSLVEKCEDIFSDYELDSTSNKNVISFQVSNIEEAISIWSSFTK